MSVEIVDIDPMMLQSIQIYNIDLLVNMVSEFNVMGLDIESSFKLISDAELLLTHPNPGSYLQESALIKIEKSDYETINAQYH